MPRCYTIKKINAQQQSIQQYCSNNNTRKGSRNGVGGASGSRNGNTTSRVEDDENINNDRVNRIATIGGGARTNKARNDCSMAKNRVRGRNGRRSSSGSNSSSNNGMTTVGNGNSIDGSNLVSGRSELKATAVQSKKLVNGTRAAVQRQCKDDNTGPTSPTEATVAPIYYTNANAHEPKMGKAFQSSQFFLFSVSRSKI